MTWDSISPLIKQIGSRAGGRRQPRPNSFLARDSMDQRLAAMRAQAQQDYTQRLVASQAQMQQQAELEALRRQAEQYQVAQLAALQSQVQQTQQQYPQQVQPVINQPDMTKALNPSAIGVLPPTAPPPPPPGTIAAPGQVGTVGMLTLNPNGTALTPEMQAKLDEARRQSEAIRAMTGRTDNYGAISPEVQAQLDAIRGQAAQLSSMYGLAAPVFMPPETKGATIGPDGSVILTGGKPPGGAPIDTKPNANKPTGAGGIDYSAYRGMTAAQVYGVHANGLPIGWDWGAFAHANGVVDPRTVDAAGRPVGNYASFGPQYQWGAPVSSNPVTTPATSSAFGSTASFNPNPMNGMGPMGSFGKPEGGGPSIFHKPAGVGSTAGGEGGTSWGGTSGGGIDYGAYTPPPNDNPFAKRPFTFGY